MDQNRASLAADLLPGISVVGLGCSAPLGSLEMPARVWGPWARRRARRKSCEQHSALGGAPALLRGDGAEGRSVFPPISPKGILQDTVCSLVLTTKNRMGLGAASHPSHPGRAGAFLCSSPPFTTGHLLWFFSPISSLVKAVGSPLEAQPGASQDPHTLTPIPSSISIWELLTVVTKYVFRGEGKRKGNEVFFSLFFFCWDSFSSFPVLGGQSVDSIFAMPHSIVLYKQRIFG